MRNEILNLILRLLPSSSDLRLEIMTADDQTKCLTLELTSTQSCLPLHSVRPLRRGAIVPIPALSPICAGRMSLFACS